MKFWWKVIVREIRGMNFWDTLYFICIISIFYTYFYNYIVLLNINFRNEYITWEERGKSEL